MTLIEFIRRALFNAILSAVADKILNIDPANLEPWMVEAIDAKAAEIANQT